jgi:hypothetical protein
MAREVAIHTIQERQGDCYFGGPSVVLHTHTQTQTHSSTCEDSQGRGHLFSKVSRAPTFFLTTVCRFVRHRLDSTRGCWLDPRKR